MSGGKFDCSLTIRRAWWVMPYSLAVKAFLASIAPFLDEDDERIDVFINRQVEFIARHGFKVVVS